MKPLRHIAKTQAIRLLAIMAVFALYSSQTCHAQLSKEYRVKLAFLYKFANYVEHAQAGNRDHVTIGVYGPDPFGETLDGVAAKRKVRGKKLRVLRFDTLDEYRSCDVLFVSGTVNGQELRQLLDRTENDGVLVVGEQPRFTAQGGIMNFHIDASGKTAIQLNVDAAQARKLRIDARLMRVCDIVKAGANSP